MSYDENDARMDDYYSDLDRMFEEGLKQQAIDAVKAYLGQFGDAVDRRVLGSLAESKALLDAEHFGPAICSSAIAVELMIRFMLVRPLVQGAFLSDEWAGILTARIATGESARDRELVPAVLRQWGLDVTSLRASSSGVPVWEFTVAQLFPYRNNYVHRYDPVPKSIASISLDCAEVFRHTIVQAVAEKVGFSLELTGKWCKIVHPEVRTPLSFSASWVEAFEPGDPFPKAP